MGNDASKVRFGKPNAGGAVFRAPKGTDVPTDATTPLASAFECLGYCSTDGLTESETRESQDVSAWGGDVVNSSQTSYAKTYKFTALETNKAVLAARYGSSNVKVDENGNVTEIRHNSKELEHAVWVFEIIIGDEITRKVVADGKITETGDVVYQDGNPVGYEMTLGTYPSALIDSDNVAEYLAEYTPATE